MQKVYVISLFFILLSCSDSNINWSSYGNYIQNQRFSEIDEINISNVDQLKLIWLKRTGINSTFQSTPITDDGIMYVSLPFNHIIAIDILSGEELWRYKHTKKENWPMCCGPANKGLAIHKNTLYMGTIDSRLISINKFNGEKIWDVDVVDSIVKSESLKQLGEHNNLKHDFISGGTGVGINMAPVIYKDRVIIGITGVGYGLHVDEDKDAPLGSVIGIEGLFGRPGFLAAFDINNGSKQWHFNTIPDEGWEGKMQNTTKDGISLQRNIAKEKQTISKYPQAAKFGGGSAWTTPAIDEKNNLLYFGTGNPSPQMNGESRPGDNLYTVSLVALNALTGERKWHFQQVPHDLWGYDVASPPLIFEKIIQGKKTKVVGQASKTGWFYIHDAETGNLIQKSEHFVPQKNLFKNPTEDGIEIYPGLLGGSNWSPVSYSRNNKLAIISAIHAPIKYQLHKKNTVNDLEYTSSETISDLQYGILSSIDTETGQKRWDYKTNEPLIGGSLSTKGNLTFFGEGNGSFNAIDSLTGKKLWSYKFEAGVNAPPISLKYKGKQYIAVVAGGNKIMGFPQGDYIALFTLDKN